MKWDSSDFYGLIFSLQKPESNETAPNGANDA
jgi:hypothetical protein